MFLQQAVEYVTYHSKVCRYHPVCVKTDIWMQPLLWQGKG